MNWKIFIPAFISAFLISFPYNIIGCGPGVDAYDYYTSFFNADIAKNNSYKPFYYTAFSDLYSTDEPEDVANRIAIEWANYCGSKVKSSDARAFVMEYDVKALTVLYNNIDQNKKNTIAKNILTNSMTQYFVLQKDYEALGYIIFAKKVEPLVSITNQWDAKEKDIATMVNYIKNGIQLHNAAKKDFFKLKYAYQLTRLALYSGKNNDAVKYYDELVAPLKVSSVLQPLALSLKAGALFRLNKNKEAAYLYSKAFAESDAKKVSNFISFKWAVDKNSSRQDYLALCKSDVEKANMLALFMLNSTANETSTLAQLFALDNKNNAIPTVIAREINKIEDTYLTPLLNRQSGGKQFFYTSLYNDADSNYNQGKIYTQQLATELINMAKNAKQNNSLYYTSAAYCYFILQEYKKTNEYLALAKASKITGKEYDQWMLTNLLVSINETDKITAQEEAKLLPSLKWLQQKAMAESTTDNDIVSTWKIFYRNIMTVALAKKYHAQGDVYKEVWCVGSAEKVFNEGNYVSLDFLRNNTDIADVEKMYAFMQAKKSTSFDAFLLQNNALTSKHIIDFAGTSYLRNYDYENAITWLTKSGSSSKDTIFKSPFIELIIDVEERLSTEKKTTSKLQFAKDMLAAQKLAKANPQQASKYYYTLATGMYNITYYGHAWELVQYYRSGSDGYEIPNNATEFQKQYYGCYAAHDMYKKAMSNSNDKNFKAKCLFMMAKCSQKTASKRYSYFEPNYSYEKAEIAQKEFMKKFKNNIYFNQFITEYKGTPFYNEAYSRCSYLRDFVQKNK